MERRKFTKEFKEEAIRLTYQEGRTVADVSESLDVPTSYLYRWRVQSQEKEAFRGNGKMTSQEEEIRRLKRELAAVKEDRDILKKAISIFSGTQEP